MEEQEKAMYSPESKTPGKGNRNLSVYYLEEPNSNNNNYNNNSKTNDGVESVNSTTHNNSMNNSTMSNGRQKQRQYQFGKDYRMINVIL